MARLHILEASHTKIMMMKRFAPLACTAALLAGLGSSRPAAQGFTSSRVVSASGYVSFDRIHPGSTFRLAVVAEIEEGWHVNAHHPSMEYLIPTSLELLPTAATEGITFGEPVYPPFEEAVFAFTGGKTLRVYQGRVPIGIEASAARNLAAGDRTFKASLTVQACNDSSCLAPAKIPIEIPITIARQGDPVNALDPDIFDTISFAGGAYPSQAGALGGDDAAAPEGAAEGNIVARWVTEQGWATALAFIFLGGLALNLTPCVYPLIPITLAYFGGQAAGRPGHTFGLASLYVVGMCATYSALGVLAATTGGVLGSVLQNPISLSLVALVLVALGLSMLGLYDIQVPMVLRRRIMSRPGFGGALFMGLTVGLVAAPCVGPFVVSLIAYVGQTGNPVLGFWLFFVLALGLGLPYLFLGGFTGAATGLPKAGPWMVWVKKVFGCIMFVMAFYFVTPLLPDAIAAFGLPAILLGSSVYLGFVESSPVRSAGFRAARISTAAIAAIIAAALMIPASASEGIQWEPYTEARLAASIERSKPVLIDFTADWCLPCKELEGSTFNDPAVVAASLRFTRLRADITRQFSESVKALQTEYEILGAPTIIFIDSSGHERKDLRLTGFENAEGFLPRLRQVR